MKNIIGGFILILTIWGVWLLDNADASSSKNNEFSKLTFRIETSKNQFLLSEPMPFILTVKNETDKMVRGSIDLDFSSPMIKIIVENPDKFVSKFQPSHFISDSLYESNQIIAPYKEFKKKQLLQNNLENFFSKVGEYKIWIELCNDQCIQSNVVLVSIILPKGDDYTAFNDLKKIPDILNVHPKKYKEALELFVLKHSNSAYTNFVRYNLAQQYIFFQEYNEAKECLEKISSDFYFADILTEDFKLIDKKVREQL